MDIINITRPPPSIQKRKKMATVDIRLYERRTVPIPAFDEYNDLFDAFIIASSKFHSGVVESDKDEWNMSRAEIEQRDYYVSEWKKLETLMDTIAGCEYVFRRFHHLLVSGEKRRLDTDEADHDYIRIHYKRELMSYVHREGQFFSFV